jgi:hypothetical protein
MPDWGKIFAVANVESTLLVAKCDSEIERLKVERRRIVTEWGQKKLGRDTPPGEAGV